MSFDAASIVFGLLDFLRIVIFVTVPVFLVSLPVLFAKERIAKKFSLNWFQSALITTYLAVTIILIFLYLYPYALGFSQSQIAGQTAPSILATTPQDILIAVFLGIIKILTTALILTVLLLPFEFFAVFAAEKLKEAKISGKEIPLLAQTFAAAFCTCLLALIIVFFIFPWTVNGIIFLIYWG
ncbi:MAG TPA: hypothetical protein VI977_01640 [archaeon]|nr:hypothetical protein [archaeon]